MEITHEQIMEIISEITNGKESFQDLGKQGLGNHLIYMI